MPENEWSTNGTTMISLWPDNKHNCYIPDLPGPVFAHATVKTKHGIISCGGGCGDGSHHRQDGVCKCYRLTLKNEWVPFPTMNKNRGHFFLEEGSGKLLAIGGRGDSMEWIDIPNGKNWTEEALPFSIVPIGGRPCIAKVNETHFLQTGGYLGGRKVSKRIKPYSVIRYNKK